MRRFRPYKVQHLELSWLKTFLPPTENSFLVFWWKKIPLGHLWIDRNKLNLGINEFQKLVADTVWPTLYNYLKDVKECEGLYQSLLHDDQATINRTIEHGLTLAPPHFATEDNTNKPISVVICTRNRSRQLWYCLDALMASSDQNFEVVVVDNAPDDNSTEEVIKLFPKARYVREDRKGLDIARNTGAKNATFDIIAYTDDDVIVDKEWVRNIKTCFKDPLTMAATGLVIPVELKTKSQYVFEKHWGFNRGYLPIVFDHKYFMDNLAYGVPVWNIGAGANMAFRKEIFQLVGYFDERLDVGASGCSGDSEMWYRILAEGWNCNYFPNAVVYHHHRETKKDLHKQIFNYMRGQVSSLMVQYENYGHEGNLDRIGRGLPKYYKNRIKDFFKRRGNPQIGTIVTEMRGCRSGKKFYEQHKHLKRIDELVIPASLKNHVCVKDNTVVSIVIPCFNHAHYLHRALQSIYKQSYRNFEIIVVDDGSIDETPEICAQYKEVKYLRVERVGLSAARNIGAQYSTGSFVVFLDADDILYPNALELNLYYFKLYPWAAFISGGHDRIDDNGDIIESQEKVPLQKIGDNYPDLLQGNYIGMEATVMYRRDLFPAFHFDTRLRACEDYDLNLRISRHFQTVSHTTKIAGYRMHQSNMSHNKEMMYEMAVCVLKKQETQLVKQEEKDNYHLGLENWKNYYKVA